MYYDQGLRFSCRRCSACCRLDPGFVYLSRADLTNLCRKFRMGVREFVGAYCRWAQYDGGSPALCLREKPNFDCILWDGGCTAYDARPVQCSTFPFWPWILEDAGQWEDCAGSCPGMGSGRLWTRDEIEGERERHERNLPVREADLRGEL